MLIEKILEPGEQLPARLGVRGHHRLRRAGRHRPGVRGPGRRAGLARPLDAGLRGGEPADYAEMIHGTKRADRRRHPALRGAAAGPAGARRRRAVPGGRGGCARRDPRGVPGLPQLPAGRAPSDLEGGLRARRAHGVPTSTEPSRRCSRCCWTRRDPIAVRFQQTSGMVMAKGVEDTAFYRYTRLGTLTEVGADPTEFRCDAGGVPRRMRPPPGRAAAVHDHAVHARHQAQRGHPGPDLGARRDAGRVDRHAGTAARAWPRLPTGRSRTCCGRPSSAPGRPAASGCRPTRKRLPARPATPPPGRIRTRTSKRARRPPSTRPSTTRASPRVSWRPRGAASTSRPASNSLVGQAGPADHARRAGRLPGHRVLGPVADRPGQPAAGRLRAPRSGAGSRRRRRSCPASVRRASKLLVISRALRLRRDRPELFTGLPPVTATRCRRRARARPSTAARGALTLATRLPVGLEQRGGWRDTAVELAGRHDATSSPGASFGPGPCGGRRAAGPTRWPCWCLADWRQRMTLVERQASRTVRRLGAGRLTRVGRCSRTASGTP